MNHYNDLYSHYDPASGRLTDDQYRLHGCAVYTNDCRNAFSFEFSGSWTGRDDFRQKFIKVLFIFLLKSYNFSIAVLIQKQNSNLLWSP